MRKGDRNPNVEKFREIGEKRWESIKSKCDPAGFEIAQLWKETIDGLKALGDNPPKELVTEIQARVDRRLIEIHAKHSGCIPPEPNRFAGQIIFSDVALDSVSDQNGVIEQIHWERHKTPLSADAKKMQTGDWDASRRIQRTWADLEQLRCEKGPIENFKGDLEHANMFQVLWGFGIESLTPTELADFFDRYCPCGSDAHDVDALKNQRKRFHETLTDSVASTQP